MKLCKDLIFVINLFRTFKSLPNNTRKQNLNNICIPNIRDLPRVLILKLNYIVKILYYEN